MARWIGLVVSVMLAALLVGGVGGAAAKGGSPITVVEVEGEVVDVHATNHRFDVATAEVSFPLAVTSAAGNEFTLRFSGVARFRVPAAGAKSPSLLGEELSGRVAVNVRRLDRRTRFVGRISLGNTTRTTLGTLRDVEVEGPDKSGTKQRLRYSSGLRFSLGGIDYVVVTAGGGNSI